MKHASSGYWDEYFAGRKRAGTDLDWGGRWTEPFLPWPRSAHAEKVLELGCGTGNDAMRLAALGFEVTATDFSPEAIATASARFADRGIAFEIVDVTERLPFTDGQFDAVMANVSLHMFSDVVTRRVFAEIARVVRHHGLLLFHVNSEGDRELRALRRPVAQELEPNYVLEEAGQTVRFFSRNYLLDVLEGWAVEELERLEISDNETGAPFKRVWRVVARRR
jgi:SAM-dependent methyltransferase